MKKYQEALNYLRYANPQIVSSWTTKLDKCKNILQELIDKSEKYQWHKVIPGKSYPPSDGRYLCKIEYQNTFIYTVCEWTNYMGFVLDILLPGMYKVVAFKCIEEFEDS